MKPPQKEMHFNLPQAVHEEFFLMFPGKGERVGFLREIIGYALELGPDSRIASRVKARMRAEEEE